MLKPTTTTTRVIIAVLITLLLFYLVKVNSLMAPVAFVFDFDETLGNFIQFSELCTALETMYNMKMGTDEYVYLLNIFPRYLRQGILPILKMLATYRKKAKCKIVIYTNNQGGRKWVRDVSTAIGNLIGEPKLFDKIIYAYKFDMGGPLSDTKGESCRTSHDKRHDDFLACTRYSANTRIVFVDDMIHTKMVHPLVSYVHIGEYRWNYDRDYIVHMCKQHAVIPIHTEHGATLSRSLIYRKASTNEQQRHYKDVGTLLHRFIETYINVYKENKSVQPLAGGMMTRMA